jgi:hypothetical protein
MNHRHHGRQRRTHREPAIAFVAACDDCAHLIGRPEPSEHCIRMAPVHLADVPGLEALGWITTPAGPHEPPDCCCIHYHLEHWEGGHGDDCCGLGDGSS